jgi:hypothetical protein
MGSINGKPWTDEQLARMDYMLDTKRDTTLTGSPRCDYCYKGVDYYDDVEWMRCTEAATAKVRVTSRDKTYDAVSCEGCLSRIQRRKHDDLDEAWDYSVVVKISDLRQSDPQN